MNSHILCIDIEASNGNGEDSHLIDDNTHAKFVVLGAFDGLGGRSAGFEGKTGGQIASQEATRITKNVLTQWNGRLTKDVAQELQDCICRLLKSKADLKMEKSRLSGTLTGKRLCTTIALVSVPKQVEPDKKAFEISLAWMGDSRVYFLSPQKGLQQLTVDDLEIEKDAFQMIREDPRMSQYLTADIPTDWQIHFALESFDEKGCILVCTDGCFQYLPTPWDFEKLLLNTLIDSGEPEDWRNLLIEKYEKIKQDDVSLILYPIGFSDFDDIKTSYQNRLKILIKNYKNDTISNDDLWNSYRYDYEVRLMTKNCSKYVTEKTFTTSENSITENYINESQSQDIANKLSINISKKNVNNNTVPQASIPNKQCNQDLIKNLLEQALRFEQSNDVKQAIHKYSDILNIDTTNVLALFHLGFIYLKLEDYHASINYFTTLLSRCIINQTDQYYKDSLRWLAQAYYHINRLSEAVIHFDRLEQISKCNDFSDFQLNIYAELLYSVERYEHTLQVCHIIHYRDQFNPLAFYLKGLILYKYNRFQDAKYYLKQSYHFYQMQFQHTRHPHLGHKVNEVYAYYQKVCKKLNNSSSGRSD